MIQVLIVGITAERLAGTARLLHESGYETIAASSFDEALRVLADHSPSLLISELRLGAFNGLHLVIRTQITHPVMRSILLDRSYDALLETEAKRQGAVYLVEPVGEDELLAHVSRIRAEATQRRWPRKMAGDCLVVRVAHRPARVIDLSYGGLRLEVLEPADVASRFEIAIPAHGIGVRAKPIWTSAGPAGWYSCGAQLADGDPEIIAVWRTLVDSVHDAA
jgi:DNA-binding response OmpR family regulator